jgi:RNA polymerase sigma-70 factor (ECF subfamily)
LNYIRDKKKRKENHFIEIETKNLNAENVSEKIEGAEILSLMERAIEELDFEEREIIVLREFEEYSYKEISELLNIPIGSVMSKLFYARKKLAEKLRSKI